MKITARRAQRQQGEVRRRVAAILAGSALAVLALVACHPESGRQESPAGAEGQAEATAGPVRGTGRMQATRMSTSPQQLAVPYAYEDHGQQMFAREPAQASPDKDGPWPAPVRMNREAAKRAATTGSMEVGLPDGTRYPVVFERVKQGPRGNMTWIGRVA